MNPSTRMHRKTYRLSPEIEREIQRLLRPETDTTPPQITIVFGYPLPAEDESEPQQWEVPEVLRQHIRKQQVFSRMQTYWADFTIDEIDVLLEAYRAIEHWPRKEIWIGGYPLPYAANLWMPLLFFYLVEPLRSE